jgi:nucleoside-diphosphate-sugar epimerase
MKILLIGGTSLVGPHLIKELLNENYTVATFTRSGKSFLTETSFQGDRNNAADLDRVISDFAPEIIVDMIPFTKTQATVLAGLIKKKNISLVAISSADIYCAYAKLHQTEEIDYQACPITETDSLRKKLGPEGEKYNKLAVEKIYLDNLSNVIILRLPAVYGFPDTTRINPYLIPMLQKQKEISVSSYKINWMFSRALNKNCAFGIFLTIKHHNTGQHIYNIAEEKTYTEVEWIERIAKICGWKGAIKTQTGLSEDRGYKQDLYISSRKIRDELGYYEKYNPDNGLEENVLMSAYKNLGKPYKKYY